MLSPGPASATGQPAERRTVAARSRRCSSSASIAGGRECGTHAGIRSRIANAPDPLGRVLARARASSSAISPRTATTTPSPPERASARRLSARDGAPPRSATASRSSREVTPLGPPAVVHVVLGSSISSRTPNRWPDRCVATDAAAPTAHSKLDAGPSPRWASGRASSSTVARICRGCSSRRTISSPRRAVERQCTRRRSSPCRYSRVARSCSPLAAATPWVASPVPDHCPPPGAPTSGQVRGTTTSGSVAVNARCASHMPNGSDTASASGPMS
jgi:hypothetical protein